MCLLVIDNYIVIFKNIMNNSRQLSCYWYHECITTRKLMSGINVLALEPYKAYSGLTPVSEYGVTLDCIQGPYVVAGIETW